MDRHPHNDLFTFISYDLISSAEDIYIFSSELSMGKSIPKIKNVPRRKKWLSLYKKSKNSLNIIISRIKKIEPDCLHLISIFEFFLLTPKTVVNQEIYESVTYLKSIPKDEFSEVIEEFTEFKNELLQEHEIAFNSEINEEKLKRYIDLFNTPEMIFFIRVWFPCWILYGTLPSILLRKARLGDQEALERILRLDKSTGFDDKISEIIHKESINNPHRYNVISKALLKGPKRQLNRRRIKLLFAGLISKIALFFEQIGHPRVTAPQIQKMFDDYAQKQGLGPIDPDLADLTAESFYKQVQLNRNFWTYLPKPEKK